MRFGSFWVLLVACRGCKACADPLPTDTSDETDPHTDEPVDTDREDTGPVPPCPNPESEPNGLDDPDPLTLEEVACGAFQASLDADAWTLVLPEDDWMFVRVDARSLGSRADPALVLSSTRGGSAQSTTQNDGFEDPWLLFPASAGTWSVLITEELGAGDPDDYGYELLAGVAKAPVTWTTVDPGANETSSAAAPLAFDDVLFGTIDGPTDVDWYTVEVPVGKQALRFTVDAGRYGSAGNFSLSLFDAGGRKVAEAWVGLTGVERDPVLRYTSLGGEDLFLRVQEESGRNGEAYWYLLTPEVEE